MFFSWDFIIYDICLEKYSLVFIEIKMYMKKENFDSLVKLMDAVISGNKIINVMTITNPQYNEMYLRIFLDELENNNGEPIPYDAFGDRLWTMLNKDVNSFEKEANKFMSTWSAWVYLYRYLKKNDRIK